MLCVLIGSLIEMHPMRTILNVFMIRNQVYPHSFLQLNLLYTANLSLAVAVIGEFQSMYKFTQSIEQPAKNSVIG